MIKKLSNIKIKNSFIEHPQNGHCIACYEINKRFEVIGNIYDNPELLGGE